MKNINNEFNHFKNQVFIDLKINQVKTNLTDEKIVDLLKSIFFVYYDYKQNKNLLNNNYLSDEKKFISSIIVLTPYYKIYKYSKINQDEIDELYNLVNKN